MAKGSQFERDCCKRLSEWWEPGRDDIFWRTAGSGARMTTRHKKGKSTRYHSGDIAAIDPSGQTLLDIFSIECKKGYGKITVADVLDRPDKGAKPIWVEWLEQVTTSQKQSGAHAWMLITRRNNRKTVVFVPSTIITDFNNLPGFDTLQFSGPMVEIGYEDYDSITGVTLDDWLGHVTPDMVKALAKRISLTSN